MVLQARIGAAYLAGAACWIINSATAGWGDGAQLEGMLTLGISAVVGASLFHVGAMLQLLDALNDGSSSSSPRLSGGANEDLEDLLPLADKPRFYSEVVASAAAAALRSSSSRRVRRQHSVEGGAWPLLVIADGGAGDSSTHSSADTTTTAAPSDELVAVLDTASIRSGASASSSGGGKKLALPFDVITRAPSASTTVTTAPSLGGSNDAGSTRPLVAWGGGAGRPLSSSNMAPKPGHRAWVWWAWRPHDRAFQAAFSLVVGTTIFLAACVAGFPGVLPGDLASSWVLWDLFFWSPFLLGSCLFIASSLLSLLDALQAGGAGVQQQPCGGSSTAAAVLWWQPLVLQCVFNVIGSAGFWLCSFFGFFAYPAQRYQKWGMAFSCLWGSCCFALAAALQLAVACRARLRGGGRGGIGDV